MDHAENIPIWKRALDGFLNFARPKQSRAIWQHSTQYWLLRKRWNMFSFRLLRSRHSLGTKWRALGETARMLLLILRAIGGSFVFAFFLVAICALTEFGFRYFIDTTESYARQWHFLAWFYPRLRTLHLDSATAASLLGTLAQIAGVFLGLYFAVVGTLISARYTNVPPNVRDLMFADKLGNQYIKLVAMFGAMATILLAAQSLGIPIGLLNLVIVALLGAATILSFVILGRRAFAFFDPGSLVRQLSSELVGWIDRASELTDFRRQQSFQAHFQKQSDALLGAYQGVVRLAAQENVSREYTLPYLAQSALRILAYYARRKHRFASESYWFPRQFEHKNWLTTDFTETNMALRTGTALRPMEVPDHLWFEKKTAETFWFAYDALLVNNHLEQATDVSLDAAEALAVFGEYMLVSEAREFASAWAPFFRREAVNTKAEDETIGLEERDLPRRLAILDCYALGAIKLLLSFATSVSEAESDRLREALSNPDWLQGNHIYKLNAPRPVIVALERIRSKVDFERQVEGGLVTAQWYLRQLVAFEYGRWYRDSLNAVLTLFETILGGDLDTLLSENCWPAAASLSGRGLEGCSKFRHRLDSLRTSHDKWLEWRGHAEADWPTVDWVAVEERLTKLESRIQIANSELLIPLSRHPRQQALPDYFGHALGVSTQACFEAIVLDRDEQVNKIFPSLFMASLDAFERLRGELKDYPLPTNVMFSTEPIENLMELSGYAIVYSELGPKSTWRTVKATWDTYFDHVDDRAALAQWLLTVMEARGSSFALNPGDLQRTTWKQYFEHDMRQRGWSEDRWFSYSGSGKVAKQHPSPIVRALLRGGHVFSDLSDVFLTVYLLKQPFAEGRSTTRKTESFAKEYARELERDAVPDEGQEEE